MDLHTLCVGDAGGRVLADEERWRMMMAGMASAGHSACGKRFKPAPPFAPVAMMLKLAVPYFTNGADVVRGRTRHALRCWAVLLRDTKVTGSWKKT